MANVRTSKFFRHQTLRNIIIGFGELFSNVQVVAFDSNGTEAKRQVVPVRYGPREKWLVATEQSPEFERPYAMVYPRMAYELTSLQYDATRKQPSLSYTKTVQLLNSPAAPKDQLVNNFSYAPVPYLLGFALYITSKSADEAAQIVEQIVPFFTPDFAINVNSVVEQGTTLAMPVTLTNVEFTDSYAGDFRDRRIIEWTLRFEIKMQFYGPVRSGNVVRTSDVNVDPLVVEAQADDATLETKPHHTELETNLLLRMSREVPGFDSTS